MFPVQIEESLTAVELQFNAVSAALAGGEPTVLASASAALRLAAVDLSALLRGPGAMDLKNRNLKARVKKIATGLVAQRENLIRRTALVEMSLNAVLPVAPSATYGQTIGPYASVGRQSRVVKYLAA
jgi:hypothetical protein